MNVENYQNLVIGSGVSGKLVGWTLAKRGQKTVVVERSMIGGACPNVACLPSKNVIHSAKAIALVDPQTGLGITTGQVRVDMPSVARRKRKMVDELVALHLEHFKASGAELVMGEARFIEPKTVDVNLNDGGSRRPFKSRCSAGCPIPRCAMRSSRIPPRGRADWYVQRPVCRSRPGLILARLDERSTTRVVRAAKRGRNLLQPQAILQRQRPQRQTTDRSLH